MITWYEVTQENLKRHTGKRVLVFKRLAPDVSPVVSGKITDAGDLASSCCGEYFLLDVVTCTCSLTKSQSSGR